MSPGPKTPKNKRFSKMRMVARGWTQPGRKMRERIVEGIWRKTESTSESMAKKAFVRAGNGKSREELSELFARSLKYAINKQWGRVKIRICRTAAKYALDAVGVTNAETRKKIHTLMADAVETMSTNQKNPITRRHIGQIFDEVMRCLGITRAVVFLRRFDQISKRLSKETEIS